LGAPKEGWTVKRKHAIFDMDGVLVDSQPLHFKIDGEVLKAAGASAGMEDVIKRAGMANADRWASYIQEFDITQSIAELVERHTETVMRLFRESQLKRMDGVPELLSALKRNGSRIAVASSSSLALVDLVLERLDIGQHFDVRVSGEDCGKGKPAPDVFLKAAQKIGADPGECVVIEDSANGVLAGKAAGMLVIGLRNPNSGEQDLSPADLIVDSLEQLADDLGWMNGELALNK
ncbi:MAG: HAD family phosphatase, partial [Clostridiales bacterium]|jgi:HAD superfamily hydrolase (TIGR01509 family)|nr:HAD family phosphatase [Clostridiales bacterium]